MNTVIAVALSLLSFTSPSHSLYTDEAGLNDFLIKTAGHGRVTSAIFPGPEIILTASPNHSCYVAARDVSTGSLLWRRNACSTFESSIESIALSGEHKDVVVVKDKQRLWKGFDVGTGNLVFDEPINASISVQASQDESLSRLSQLTSGVVGICANADSKYAVQYLKENNELRVGKIQSGNVALIQSSKMPDNVYEASFDGDVVDIFSTCMTDDKKISALISTDVGKAIMIEISMKGNEESMRIIKSWSQEEGLSNIVSTVILDKSVHLPIDDEMSFSFSDRLSLQLEGAKSFIQATKDKYLQKPGANVINSNDNVFGFSKVVVALSESKNARDKLFGIDTLSKGNIVWSLLLPQNAKKTVIIKDSISPPLSAHSTEVLVVSELEDGKGMEWICIDGIHGAILESGVLDTQVTSMFTMGVNSQSSHCRQVVLVLDEKKEVSVIPSIEAKETAKTIIATSDYFVHTLNREKGALTSMMLELENGSNSNFVASIVGKATIPEEIVSVAYFSPEEVIQSPATIMGDDSLLLKYLNPNLAVIISKGTSDMTDSYQNSPSKFASAETNGKQNMKPLGVSSNVDSSVATQAAPSLFVSLVDTVSGKVLHRVSHVDASGHPDLGVNQVPVVISENWVLYSFWNHRTKRSEIGVLTLHEGMIEKYGMTAFKSPHQETTFSSFDSPSPVVLQKTFTLSKRVTSLGVTQTTLGISLKNFLFGLDNGQIVAINRNILDPRRPLSKPTESEKEERLSQYSPIIPLLVQKTASYSLLVEGVAGISSVRTNLESQSLMLAYGGPDIFFSRIAPSKGFDLLPESFNRQLLLTAVFILVGITKWLSDKNKSTSLGLGWA